MGVERAAPDAAWCTTAQAACGSGRPAEAVHTDGQPAEAVRTGGPPEQPGRARQETAIAREIRAEGLALGRSFAEVATSIHDRCGPVFGTTLVRASRLALGIALADVVAQVRALFASEGRAVPRFSETLLSAYEAGQKRPGPEYLHYLCCVYRTDPPGLGYAGPCLCGQPHGDPVARGSLGAAPPAGQPAVAGCAAVPPEGQIKGTAPAHACPEDTRPGEDLTPERADNPGQRMEDTDDDLLRRMLLRLIADAGAPVDDRFFGAIERVRRRLDDALLGSSVSVTMLDHWEGMAAEYGRQYMTVPPLRLLCDVVLDLADVRRMCEHRQPIEFADRLCRLAARLAGLTGMTMIDLGDQRLARSFFRTARMAADETGDRHLRGWVAVREALVPLYYGDPAETAAQARASADLAGRTPSVAGVMAPVVEARALARLVRRRKGAASRQTLLRAGAALDRAHEALDSLPIAERRDTAFGYTERQLLFHEGDALVTLGDHRGADDAFSQALRLYSPKEVLDRSLVELGRARCRLEAGEPEEALRLSRDTLLGVPSQHRSGIVLRTAHLLGDVVEARHGEFDAVHDYREALLSA
ncbi:MAG TPA: XRE family transcriptional regulator [Streptosporangiaceae bacterium]|nr:XRE family transcriptional regulator [Streptosporangiaceae bacterium]